MTNYGMMFKAGNLNYLIGNGAFEGDYTAWTKKWDNAMFQSLIGILQTA
jgi:hypothetical protein